MGDDLEGRPGRGSGGRAITSLGSFLDTAARDAFTQTPEHKDMVCRVESGANAGLWVADGAGGWSQLDSEAEVSGPGASIDGEIPRFDGTTGKLLQQSGAIITDAGALTVNGTTSSVSAIFKSNQAASRSSVYVQNSATGASTSSSAAVDSYLATDVASRVATRIQSRFINTTDATRRGILEFMAAASDVGASFVVRGGLDGENWFFGDSNPASWQTMRRGMFQSDATAVPTGNPTAGYFWYSSGGEAYVRTSGGQTIRLGGLKATAIKTAAYTAVVNVDLVPYDASGGTFVLKAPASPQAGDIFAFAEAVSDATAVTWDGNGANIEHPVSGGFAATQSVGVADIVQTYMYLNSRWKAI